MDRSLPRLVTNAKLIEGCSVSMCSNDLNFAKSTPQCLELAKPKHATLCGRGCDVWYNVCCTGKCGSPERALTGKTLLLKMSCPPRISVRRRMRCFVPACVALLKGFLLGNSARVPAMIRSSRILAIFFCLFRFVGTKSGSSQF